ncbi:hypothetical protein WICPIJ_005196 [Wickerhamomyces pijperi]|uniref:DUF2470 domain-containing protein n=1 Tax=Wickerhamomyces pijperi TaxID=599730 RepID=A0A9P8Q407_WICPI|nr:hypothetical protein WICPIJ_005196 [Wickerhamomyces pijperi]
MSSNQKTPEERIISHMNKDHKLSVQDYLVAFGKLDMSKVKTFQMTHIDTESLTITFRLKNTDIDMEKIIPFDPPMKSLADSRDRLVIMAKEAAAKQGVSHIQINEYAAPSAFELFLYFVFHAGFFVGLFPVLLDNHIVASLTSQTVIDWLVRYSFQVEIAVILVHIGEVYFLLKPLIEFYRVEDFQIEWYIAVLIEGFPAIRRLKALVAKKLAPAPVRAAAAH